MRVVASLLAIALVVGACTTGETTDDRSDGAATTGTSASPTAEGSSSPAAPPGDDDPAGDDEALAEQLAWVLAALDGATVTEDEYSTRFADAFTEQVPFDQFVALLDAQLRPAGPFSVTDQAPQPTGGLVVQLSGATGDALAMTIALDDEDRIETLFVAPAEAPTLDDPPATLDDAVDRLETAGELHLVAAEVDGTSCSPTVEVASDEPVAIGSAFKLYVLGAVADAVAAGDLAWDDELTITAEVKSLPSGILQTRDDGSTVTVRDAAELMIAISDNTATDLLLTTVGREAVEQAQAAHGHAEPALNIPFLTTREFFLLKADEEAGDAWVAAGGDVAARRDVLADLAGRTIDEVPVSLFLGDPVRPTEIEWFASPLDLCRALATLLVRAEQPDVAPVAEILTANPGVPDEDGTWARIAFKGGSEPGVLTLAWLVEDDEGNRRSLVGSLVSETAPVADETELSLLLGAARDLLAGSR